MARRWFLSRLAALPLLARGEAEQLDSLANTYLA